MTSNMITWLATKSRQALILTWPLLSFACWLGRVATAQALPAATGPGTYVIAGGTISSFNGDYGKQQVKGGSFYIDTNLFWRYGIETEFRRTDYPNFGESQMTVLAGPRMSFRAKGIVPYVKVLAGGGRFTFPYGYGHGDYFVVAPGAGVDLTISPKIRVRMVDFEYQEWPGFTFGAIHPYGISAGVSYQLVGSSRKIGYHHVKHAKITSEEARVDTGLWK